MIRPRLKFKNISNFKLICKILRQALLKTSKLNDHHDSIIRFRGSSFKIEVNTTQSIVDSCGEMFDLWYLGGNQLPWEINLVYTVSKLVQLNRLQTTILPLAKIKKQQSWIDAFCHTLIYTVT